MMMMRVGVVFVLLLVAPVASASMLERDMQLSLKTRPVMKVVRMLQDMKAELTKEMEDDKAVYEMLTCWCETNDKEKTQAIATGEANAEALEADMGVYAAKIKELKGKLAAAKDEYNSDWTSLKEAKSMRMKENKEFHMEEVSLISAIKACKQAIVVLSTHHPELAQVRDAAKLLQSAKVGQLIVSSNVLTPARAGILREFLDQVPAAQSFLAIPGYQSYAPQSGQIFGILKQMKETFEKDLGALQKDEGKTVADFEMLKAAKEDEMASGKKQIAQYDADIAEFGQKYADAAKELEDTEKQLAMDKEFLAKLKKICAGHDAEFDSRMKGRLAEIAAVEDTIKYLNSDEAFNVFDKSVNTAFLQVGFEDHETKALRREAVAVLRRAAGQSSNPGLALLAASAGLDAFTKVKEEIDKMVTELSKQQGDEIEHRDWCINELNANNRSTAAAYDKKAALEAKMADLKKMITSLTETIDSQKATIDETQKQMGRASDTREAENADYQQTVVDQRLTQMILQKALDRMKMVYAFLQKPGAAHVATSGTHVDPGNGPARFTKYEKNAGGSRVVALIEKVIKESVTSEDEAIASEQDSQVSYENFMKDSNDAITQLTKSILHLTEDRAKAKADLSMAKTDFKVTMDEIEGLYETNADLHKSCDYLLKNFDARQAARAAEIEALKEAKAILSGMK